MIYFRLRKLLKVLENVMSKKDMPTSGIPLLVLMMMCGAIIGMAFGRLLDSSWIGGGIGLIVGYVITKSLPKPSVNNSDVEMLDFFPTMSPPLSGIFCGSMMGLVFGGLLDNVWIGCGIGLIIGCIIVISSSKQHKPRHND